MACCTVLKWEGVTVVMLTVCHSFCTISFGLLNIFSHVVYCVALKTEAAGFSEIYIYQIIFCHIIEVSNLDHNFSSLYISLQFGE